MVTFKGKHNIEKARALFCLLKIKNSLFDRAVSLPEWVANSNCSYDYLHSRICKFHGWELVTRETMVRNGRACFGYRIGVRGEAWLVKWVIPDSVVMAEVEKSMPKKKVDSLNIKELFSDSPMPARIKTASHKNSLQEDLEADYRRMIRESRNSCDSGSDIKTDIRRDY